MSVFFFSQTLDCDVYEKIQESLTVAGQAAADIAENEATFFHSIAVEAAKVRSDVISVSGLMKFFLISDDQPHKFLPVSDVWCIEIRFVVYSSIE